jgi:hypothetical protein
MLLLLACTWINDEAVADRMDVDGDGSPWTEDCDDRDAERDQPTTWYLDGDGDGVGKEAMDACEAPGDNWIAIDGDCDDEDDAIHPAAIEICNGVDDDCNGRVDEVDCAPQGDLTTDGYEAVDGPRGLGQSLAVGSIWAAGAPSTARHPEGANEVLLEDGSSLDGGPGFGRELAWAAGQLLVSADDGVVRAYEGVVEIGHIPGEQVSDLAGWQDWLAVGDGDGGVAWLIQGPLTGLTSASFEVDDKGAFGHAVELGDLDGDGAPDLVVGAPETKWGGEVQLFDSEGGLWTVIEGNEGSDLGTGAVLADLDGDGQTDLVATGAPDADTAVWLFLDATNAEHTDDAVASVEGSPLAGRGQSLTTADLDMDGTTDLVVGAPLDGGRALVFYGPFSGALVADARIEGPELGELGTAMVRLTDGEGDDLLVGAPGASRLFIVKGGVR